MPWLKLPTELSEIDAFVLHTERFEFRTAFRKQGLEPSTVALRVMMESRRNLYEPVKERLAVAGCLEPNSLQCFVGLKVSLRVEQANAVENFLFHHDFNFWGKCRIVKFTRCVRIVHFFAKQ